MSDDERQSERYMRAVIEQLHGVTLTPHDRDGLQRAVDYVFDAGDLQGAVEVTTVTDGRAAAWSAKLDTGQTMSCASPRGWSVTVGLDTRLSELQRRLPAIVAACDRHQVDYPSRVPVTAWDADLLWIFADDSTLHPSPTARPGTIRFGMPPALGFPDAEGLDRDLAQLLSDEKIAAKLRKLRDHAGVDERHLAIGVMDAYRTGFDLLDHLLMGRDHQPRYQPPVDDFPATHLWITGGGYSVLTWTRQGGWAWRTLLTRRQSDTRPAPGR